MVRAGIMRPLGRMSRNRAPLYEVLGIDSWEKFKPPRDSEGETSSDGEAEAEPRDAGTAAHAAGGARDFADSCMHM